MNQVLLYQRAKRTWFRGMRNSQPYSWNIRICYLHNLSRKDSSLKTELQKLSPRLWDKLKRRGRHQG